MTVGVRRVSSRHVPIVDVVIPALNEAAAIGTVLNAIPRALVRHVVVADNGSTDATSDIARAHGARVVFAPRRGYGAACLQALAYVASDAPDIVVFMDADASDDPSELPALLAPIERDEADLVIGSRTLGQTERGALTAQQQIGNRIASTWLRLRFPKATPFTDLGPFRAIRWSTLLQLRMRDLDYGWTVEMQIKALQQGARCAEVPVHYRKRIGESKVSGTVRGTLGASTKIIWWLTRASLAPR